jgi:hypothetical protein
MRTDVLPLLLAAALLGGCGDDAAAPDQGGERGVVASAPVPRAALGREGAGSVVFISALPGTRPDGATGTIANRTSGAEVAVTVRDGGFDPVSIAAGEGDRIEVSVAGGATPSSGTVTARSGTRPKVVRTSPSPRQTDVPLNVRLAVVFSAPMDPASARASVQLLKEQVPVDGSVILAPDGLLAEFRPALPLAPGSSYALVVSGEVRDVLGSAIESGTSVPFQTGSSEAAVVELRVEPYFDAMPVGDSLQVVMYAGTTRGIFIGVSSKWSSSDPAVMGVVLDAPDGFETIWLHGLRPGMAMPGP